MDMSVNDTTLTYANKSLNLADEPTIVDDEHHHTTTTIGIVTNNILAPPQSFYDIQDRERVMLSQLSARDEFR